MPNIFDRAPGKAPQTAPEARGNIFDRPVGGRPKETPAKGSTAPQSNIFSRPTPPPGLEGNIFAGAPTPEIAPDALRRTPLPQEIKRIREAIEEPGESYFLKTLEVLDTPRQILLRAAHKMLTGSFEKMPEGNIFDRGTGPVSLPKKHLEFEDILEDVGLPEGAKVALPLVGSISARGVAGFVGDIILDPLNLVGIGGLTKVGKLAKAVKSAEKIEEASKLGKAISKAKTAGENVELAATAAEQAKVGQRALVSLAGHSVVQGAPIFEGARIVKEYIAASGPGKALRTLFSTKTGMEELDSIVFRYRNLMTHRLRKAKEEFEELGKTLKDSEVKEIQKIASALDQGIPIRALSDDPAVRNVASELKDRFATMKTLEEELGILSSEIVNYFPRIMTKEAAEAIQKTGKVAVKVRLGGGEFRGTLGKSEKFRTTREFNINEINTKLSGEGFAEFFTTDPILGGYLRTVRDVRGRTSVEMFNELKALGLVKAVRPDPELLKLRKETADRIARRAFTVEQTERSFRKAKERTFIPEPGAEIFPPATAKQTYKEFDVGALHGPGKPDPFGLFDMVGESETFGVNAVTGRWETFDFAETRETLKKAESAKAKRILFGKEKPSRVADEFVELAQKRVAYAEKGLQPILDNQAAVKAGRLVEIKGIKGLDGYAAPKEVADFLTRQHKALTNPKEMTAFGEYYDKAQNWWKAWSLFVFPSYHVRNQVGNAWLSWLAGMRNPYKLVASLAVQKGDNVTIKAATGRVYGAKLIRELIDEWNINGTGLYGAEVPSAMKAVEIGEETAGNIFARTIGMENPALEMGLRAGTALENVWRRALFMDGLEKGLSPQLAAERTKKFLFDYTDLSDFEKSTMKRLFPFYSWTRKNLPVELESLVSQPYKFTLIEKGRDQIEGEDVPHVPSLPDFFREYVPIRVRKREDGIHEYFLLGGWLPAADIERLFGIKRLSKLVLDLLSPFAAIPLEQGLNISKFSGRPIERVPGEKELFLNVEMPRRQVQALRNIRLLSELDNIIRQSPAYPEQVLTPEAKTLRALTGIKIQKFDPTREKIFREKAIKKSIIREVYKRAGEKRAEQLQRELAER